MKKVMFNNVSRLTITVLLITGAITSCKKTNDILTSNSNDAASSAQYRRTGLSTVPLKVTVAATDNVGNAYKITGDGNIDNNGDYVNSLQNVSASFDQYGNLQFDTNPGINNKTKPVAQRWMNFTFDSPVTGSSAVNPANHTTNPKGDYRMVTNINGQTPAQSMSIPSSETIELGGGFTDGSSTDWNFSFHYNNVGATSYATLTRIDSKTWTITGATNPPIARLISNGIVIGFYNLPFSLTLTAL
jgi:hypothetical protein